MMSGLNSFDICRCPCHGERFGGTVKHLVACCAICPHCGQRIKSGAALHEEACRADYEKLLGKETMEALASSEATTIVCKDACAVLATPPTAEAVYAAREATVTIWEPVKLKAEWARDALERTEKHLREMARPNLGRVFILDDRRSVQIALEGAGLFKDGDVIPKGYFSVARNIRDGIDTVVWSELFDIWVLDNDLGPGEEGYEFLKRMIDKYPTKVAARVVSCSSNPPRREAIEKLFANWEENGREPLTPIGADP